MFWEIILLDGSAVFIRIIVLFDWGSNFLYAGSPRASLPHTPSPVTMPLQLKYERQNEICIQMFDRKFSNFLS